MTEKQNEPAPDRHRPRTPTLAVDGDRAAWERKFVQVACVGSNAEFRATVERLAFRGSLKLVHNNAPDPTVGPDGNIDPDERL